MLTMRLGLIVSVALFSAIAEAAAPVPPNVRVSNPQPGTQNEEQVWFCPHDSTIAIAYYRNLTLGYRQTGISRASFGGLFWIDEMLSPAFQVFAFQSDPMMTTTSSGRIILGHLDFERFPIQLDSSCISFITSDDCGESWDGPYVVEDTIGKYFEDKPFVTSDRTGGPNDGNVYVAWSRLSVTEGGVLCATSTDGAMTWADPVYVASTAITSCFGPMDAGGLAQPLVGHDGAVYVFWVSQVVDSSDGCSVRNAVRFNKSLDGGVSWLGGRTIFDVIGGDVVEGPIEVISQPTTEADISSGPHRGNLYVQYRDSSGIPPYDSDIFFRRSLDTGHTWSEQFRVNDDQAGVDADQFHNWMVSNEHGTLVSIWYDQRTDPAHFKFDVFAAYSYDGGETWTSNHRVSSTSIDPALLGPPGLKSNQGKIKLLPFRPPMQYTMAGSIAEYIGVAFRGDKVIATWTDTREGDQDVWGAYWYVSLTDPRTLGPAAAHASGRCDSLWWATAWKESEDLYRVQVASNLSFSSILVDEIVPDNSYSLTTSGLIDGGYYWRVKNYRAPAGIPAESTLFSQPAFFQIADQDSDCIADAFDNCQLLANPTQDDDDDDGRGNACDNCPFVANPTQEDGDEDGTGDACECACDCHSDPACDGVFSDVIDVVNVINISFRGGINLDDPNPSCPFPPSDVNCDDAIDVVDVVRIVNVAFRGANAAMEYCTACP